MFLMNENQKIVMFFNLISKALDLLDRLCHPDRLEPGSLLFAHIGDAFKIFSANLFPHHFHEDCAGCFYQVQLLYHIHF